MIIGISIVLVLLDFSLSFFSCLIYGDIIALTKCLSYTYEDVKVVIYGFGRTGQLIGDEVCLVAGKSSGILLLRVADADSISRYKLPLLHQMRPQCKYEG